MIAYWIQSQGQWESYFSHKSVRAIRFLSETNYFLYKSMRKEVIILMYSIQVLSVTHSDKSPSFRNTKILLILCVPLGFGVHSALQLFWCSLIKSFARYIFYSNSLVHISPILFHSCTIFTYIHTRLHFSLNIFHTLHLKTLFMNDARIAACEELLLSHNCIHMKLKSCFII